MSGEFTQMNKSFIHKAMKDWDSSDGHDSEEKNRIALILRKLRFYPVFDRTIFINKQNHTWTDEHPRGYNSKADLLRDYEVFIPDILIKKYNMIIELDGNFHFNTKKGVRQTNKRNEYYEYAGIRLIWFHSTMLKDLSDYDIARQIVGY